MITRGFVTISLLAVLVILSSATAHAVEYGALGGTPANPDPKNPRTNSIFIYTLGAKESKQDAIRVVNNSEDKKVIALYATDSELASGGSFGCTQRSDTQKDVGSWIEFETPEITLEPRSEQIVNFRVTVPTTISVGEHNGCIVVQEQGAAGESVGNGVQLSFRSALRTVVTVPGVISKNIEFNSIDAKSDPTKYVITAQLQNKGNVSLDTDVKVSIKDFLNRTVYENGGVYPLINQKEPVNLNFEYIRPYWGGMYTISGTAMYNGDPAAPLGVISEKDVTKYGPSKVIFILPQPTALAIEGAGLLVVLGAIALWIRKLREQRRIAATWKPYTVKRGDSVIGLAQRHHVKWKTVAKVNKIKAPYELERGTTIKLPPHTTHDAKSK